MSSSTQRNQHSLARQLPAVLLPEQQQLDALLTRGPIPGPKPWSDELERAAIAGCAYACAPQVSLRSLGIPSSSASLWLSDEPPEMFRSACVALAERLKEANSWCERSLLARIARAGEEPRFWASNAWILERSKCFSQQYIAVQDSTAFGPATVVNIGQVIIQAAPGQSLPNRQLVVDAELVQGGESEEIQANPTDVTLSSPLLSASNTK